VPVRVPSDLQGLAEFAAACVCDAGKLVAVQAPVLPPKPEGYAWGNVSIDGFPSATSPPRTT